MTNTRGAVAFALVLASLVTPLGPGAALAQDGVEESDTEYAPILGSVIVRAPQLPPTRTRLHLTAVRPVHRGFESVTLEWNPETPSALLREVLLPAGIWAVSVSSEPAFVGAGERQFNLAWSQCAVVGGAAFVLEAGGEHRVPICSSTEVGATPVLVAPVAILVLATEGPTVRESAFVGVDEAALMPTGGRLIEGLGQAAMDFVMAAAEVVVRRVERHLLEGLKERIQTALACGGADPVLPRTCQQLEVIRLDQLATVASQVARAAALDLVEKGLAAALPEAVHERFRSELLAIVEAVLTPPVDLSVLGNRLLQALLSWGLEIESPGGPSYIRSTLYAVQQCTQRIDCDALTISSYFSENVFWAILGSRPDQLRLRAALSLAGQLLTLQRNWGDLDAAARLTAILALVGDLALLADGTLVDEVRTLVHALQAALRGDLASVAAISFGGLVEGLSVDPSLQPLIAALTTALQAVTNPAASDEERAARRTAIADSLDNLADLQADRDARPGQWIASFGGALGWSAAAVMGELQTLPALQLGFSLDFVRPTDCFAGLHLRAGILDLGGTFRAPLVADNTERDDPEWTDILFPSFSAGLSFGSRRIPFVLAGTVGWARRINPDAGDADESSREWGFSAGGNVTFWVPIFDFN